MPLKQFTYNNIERVYAICFCLTRIVRDWLSGTSKNITELLEVIIVFSSSRFLLYASRSSLCNIINAMRIKSSHNKIDFSA